MRGGEDRPHARRAAVRLLTLTGPGGIGKTRLGIEAARRAAGYFPDGVAFVALAPLGDAALVIPTVSRTLGLREVAGVVRPLEALCQHLREKRFLLCWTTSSTWSRRRRRWPSCSAPARPLRARDQPRALRVRGEREYPVSPLAVPDPTRTRERKRCPKRRLSSSLSSGLRPPPLPSSSPGQRRGGGSDLLAVGRATARAGARGGPDEVPRTHGASLQVGQGAARPEGRGTS